MCGHDECIFRQYHVPTKSWKGPSSETVLIPKDDGQGIMICAFQSREAGFRLELTDEQLTKVKECRASKKYANEKAAQSKKGTELHQPLTESPFVKEFEYGANNDGNWSYTHMVLQVDDCI